MLERGIEGCLVQLWCTLLFVFAILINMEQLSKLLKLVLFLPEISALQIDVASVSCGGVLEGKRLGNFAATVSGQNSPVRMKESDNMIIRFMDEWLVINLRYSTCLCLFYAEHHSSKICQCTQTVYQDETLFSCQVL